MTSSRRQLQAIDRQLAALAECQRKWKTGGTSAIPEHEVYAEIDNLLAERHALMLGQGEMLADTDIAWVSEYGPADTGQGA